MNDLVCKRCERSLPRSEFKSDARYKRGFTSWCNECHRERNREWAKENRKRLTAKSKKWRKDNPEKSKEIWRKFHAENKAKRASDRADWARKNRDKCCAATAKRKAARLRATPKWVNWNKVRAIYRQAKRLQDFTGVPMHVDHIVPLQSENVCGLHWEGNLQIMTASENCAKFNKWDEVVEEAYRQPDLFVSQPEPQPVQEGFDLD